MGMIRGSVEFEVGGKTRYLRFTTNRLVMLEEKAGRSVSQIASGMGDGNVRFADIRMMIQVGMGLDKPADAGDVVDEIGVARAIELLGEALTAAFPQVEPSVGGNGETAA